MKFCPNCRNKYPDENDFCLVDGKRLLKADPDADTLINKSSNADPETVFLQTKKTLNIGDYVDFSTPKFGFRAIIQNIVQDDFPNFLGTSSSKEFAAEIELRLDRMMVLPIGRGAKQIDLHICRLPVCDPDVQEYRSVFAFHLSEDRAIVFRLFIGHINVHSKTVELDVAYFRYAPHSGQIQD